VTDYSAQIAHYARDLEPSSVVKIDTALGESHTFGPERTTFQEYFVLGPLAEFGAIGKREPEENEIRCPVCRCAGREQVDGDRVRIYHPHRLIPCRAPAGYEIQQKPEDQLL